MKKVTLQVRSEFDPLKTVILHRPGKEIDRLTPDNKERLLFEDVPFLRNMQTEHDAFAAQLQNEGIEVLYLENLLREILEIESHKRRILFNVCGTGLQPALHDLILDHFSNSEILDILFGGITTKELLEETGKQLMGIREAKDNFLLDPIPNSYFMRDPGAVVGDQLISCKMHYRARMRETILLREIFQHHPSLNLTESQFSFGLNGNEDRPFTIEGGDIIVLNEKAIAIGCSERTRSESIAMLATNLFRKGIVQRVYEVNIPAVRAYMHLDTVFTVVDNGLVVAYPEVMNEVTEIKRYEPILLPGNSIEAIPIDENIDFNKILEREFGGLEVVYTGNGNSNYASREQLADGTNVFAIAPSKVITYERNIHTNIALKRNGVDVVEIGGSELVRGLGGPRCMTMPITRGVE